MAGITPWYVGQRAPLWIITLTDDSGNIIDLTSAASASLEFRALSPGTSSYPGAGVATILTPGTNGQISYAVAASDVQVPGNYQVIVTVNYASGLTPFIADPIAWSLLPSS